MDLSTHPIGSEVIVIDDKLDTRWKGTKGKIEKHDHQMASYSFPVPIGVRFEKKPYLLWFHPSELKVLS